MARKIKMVLYGEPGTGKSVFASRAPKPFFITTDGNYEWLEDFGADPNAHRQCNSFAEIVDCISKGFEGYETVVLDLTEDAFKWCEYEYCIKNRIQHLSDQGYGKGYDASGNEFFIEICKLLGLDKNVILLMHGIQYVVKDRRGVEQTKFGPTSRIRDKVLDMIEGRVRFFLRCYVKDEEQTDGSVVKRRYLSLVPKPNEFGIIRGVDENLIPHDIPLDFNVFTEMINKYTITSVPTSATRMNLMNEIKSTEQTTESETEKAVEIKQRRRARNKITEDNTTEKSTDEDNSVTEKIEVNDESSTEDNNESVVEKTEDVPFTPTKVVETKSDESKAMTQAERIAAIKAKLAALKK